jgi:non-ribosomal peptide synthetase component E (peptide arylation enzyme)
MMTIPFTRWPDEFATRYREKGYWLDVPMTDILTRHAQSDAVAVIDGERSFTYRSFIRLLTIWQARCRRRAFSAAKPRWYNSAMWLSFTSPSLRCSKSASRR